MKDKPSISLRVATIALVLAMTLVYSMYVKKSIDQSLTDSSSLILKDLPNFDLPSFTNNSQRVSEKNIFDQQTRFAFVHFWATWCGPCEAELPDFINLLKSYEGKGIKGLLIAVQDDVDKMKKYLKRFGEFPSNVTIVHDVSGSLMSRFGTVKIPETYLFDDNLKNINKYVGPQDWALSRYKDRLDFYLNQGKLDKKELQEKQIETH